MIQENLQPTDFSQVLSRIRFSRGLVFGVIIIAALLAFEAFNYSTTDYALRDLLGDLSFLGLRWATILAIAFCGIDFAGIARLFTPDDGSDAPGEVWYLFGAWLLAATMNAMLTWWGVSLAILNHETLGNAVIAREILLRVVPIFVAVLVWLIRVLIIGTFSVAGDRLFSQGDQRTVNAIRSSARPMIASPNQVRPSSMARPSLPRAAASSGGFRTAPQGSHPVEPVYSSLEPTYNQPAMSASGRGSNSSQVMDSINHRSVPGIRR